MPGKGGCWFGCEDLFSLLNPNIVPPAVLTCHPSTPCAAIRLFEVKIRKGEGKLVLKYRLEGDIDALDIPPTGAAHRADVLWQNTCCEAFIRGVGVAGEGNTVGINRHSGMDRRNPDCMDASKPCHPWSLGSSDPCRNDEVNLNSTILGEERYIEFNFSPSTAWAAYHFTAYRKNMTELDAIEPVKIAVRQTAHWLELEASVNLESLTMPDTITKLRLGLSAVVKQKSGDTSYWALAHPKAKPDFHHTDSFAFELGPDRP
jgi:hypothetical protein